FSVSNYVIRDMSLLLLLPQNVAVACSTLPKVDEWPCIESIVLKHRQIFGIRNKLAQIIPQPSQSPNWDSGSYKPSLTIIRATAISFGSTSLCINLQRLIKI
ncbi:MAG: hypothetical protein MJK13_11675, partial [Pseudomonadales bacterium]|nr:hypothetical protein [Pseudomonadales bacterium]